METLQQRIEQLTEVTTDSQVSLMENISIIEEALSMVLRGRAPLGSDEEKNITKNNKTDNNNNNNSNKSINNNNNNK